MENMIKALQIFFKYDSDAELAASHDLIMIAGIDQESVSEEDAAVLDDLGWSWNDENDCWSKFV